VHVKTLTYIQLEPDNSSEEYRLCKDVEILRNYLQGKVPADQLRFLNPMLTQPFNQINFKNAMQVIEQGIAYLSQYDGINLQPDQVLEKTICEDCHLQRELALSVKERLNDLCVPVWQSEMQPVSR